MRAARARPPWAADAAREGAIPSSRQLTVVGAPSVDRRRNRRECRWEGGALGRANRSGMTGDKKRRWEQIRRGRGEEEEGRLCTTKHCLRQKATAHDRARSRSGFDSATNALPPGNNKTSEEKFQLTFGPRGRRCTAPIKGGALGLLHVGLGRASVSLASACSRCLMGLGIFLRFRGTSNRSIS